VPDQGMRIVRRIIKQGTSALRASRSRRLVLLAERIDRWSEAATRRRLAVLLISLTALVIAIWPFVEVVTGVAIVANERLLGWGYCFERDPSSIGFDKRRYRRSCVLDQVSLLTWQEGPRQHSQCSDCDNRGLQLVFANESGQGQRWVEYYLENNRWSPAHVWKVVQPRLVVAGEGIVLDRIDHGIPVCDIASRPVTLEMFVPLNAGRGCAAPSLWGYSAPFARFDRWLDRVWRGYHCDPISNSLQYRWETEESAHPLKCSTTHNSDMYRPLTANPREWTPGPHVTVVRRD
jgi:hypothetical protein